MGGDLRAELVPGAVVLGGGVKSWGREDMGQGPAAS